MEYIKEQLPDLNKNYNPNHGYEPYWPGGDWVFKDPELGPNETTTKVPLVCGEECNYLYTRIGAVCARQANNVDYERCSGIWIGFCLGYRYDEFHRGFYTFDTYCKFLDAQCRTGFKDRGLASSSQGELFAQLRQILQAGVYPRSPVHKAVYLLPHADPSLRRCVPSTPTAEGY
ncbi:uncharacterized protein LOC123699812 isoform X2 [Colias croceus]|uniref:uncharacterized protein LOC123699812 isoform X2 n=1 Tax=Colias crocea TaxID=72248 RepID=UPI001E27F158|nr:uncharacterized protein LOC123699812 isoform X2 [Colias croceus]